MQKRRLCKVGDGKTFQSLPLVARVQPPAPDAGTLPGSDALTLPRIIEYLQKLDHRQSTSDDGDNELCTWKELSNLRAMHIMSMKSLLRDVACDPRKYCIASNVLHPVCKLAYVSPSCTAFVEARKHWDRIDQVREDNVACPNTLLLHTAGMKAFNSHFPVYCSVWKRFTDSTIHMYKASDNVVEYDFSYKVETAFFKLMAAFNYAHACRFLDVTDTHFKEEVLLKVRMHSAHSGAILHTQHSMRRTKSVPIMQTNAM